MSSRNNPNRIKIHRNYTVIDASETLGLHPKTIRNWLKTGLPIVDEKRPLLINGADFKVYLKQKRKAIKYDCEEYEMCCFRCKQAMKPSIESVKFIAKPAGMAQMTGECEECECRLNKYVSWRNVNDIWLNLNGKLPIAKKHLILRGQNLLNCPFNGVFDNEK